MQDRTNLPTYRQVVELCEQQSWKIVEVTQTRGAYRINVVRPDGSPRTIKAR